MSNEQIVIEIETSEQIARAEEVKAKSSVKDHWLYKASIALVALNLFSLLTLYGGRLWYAFVSTKLIVFSAAIVASLYLLVANESKIRFSLDTFSKKILIVCTLLATLGLIQLLPIPFPLLDILSPQASELYQKAGKEYGHFTLEIFSSVLSLSWFIALCVNAFWLVSLEELQTKIRVFSFREKRKKSGKKNQLLDQAKNADYLVQKLEFLTILAGVVASLIAIAHWSTGTELFLGIYEPVNKIADPKRAHWPFENPNHLSAFIGISILLTYSKILKLSYLSKLSIRNTNENNLLLSLLKTPKKSIRLLSYSFALLIMLLTNFLTLSRAGNILSLACILGLYYFYNKTLKLQKVVQLKKYQRSSKKESKAIRALSKNALLISSLFGLYFLLGQTGRELFIDRVEYGLVTGYDEMRRLIAVSTLGIIADYPLFGSGLGTWNIAVMRHIPVELAGWNLGYAHNDHLQLFAELGLLGFALLLVLLVTVVKGIHKTWTSEIIAAERFELISWAIVALYPLLHAFFDFPFHLAAIAYLSLISFVCLLRTLKRLNNKD